MKTRNKLLTIRFTKEERQVVNKKARKANLSTSNYIRYLLGLPLAEMGGDRTGTRKTEKEKVNG